MREKGLGNMSKMDGSREFCLVRLVAVDRKRGDGDPMEDKVRDLDPKQKSVACVPSGFSIRAPTSQSILRFSDCSKPRDI
jgi:hypothetical protein